MNTIKVTNPYDESLIEELERTSEKEAFAVLENSHRLFTDRTRWLPLYRRIEILENAAEIIESRSAALAKTAAREGGKPLIDSKIEINRAIEGIKVAVKELSHFCGREIPMNLTLSSANRIAYTIKEPRGVVMAISAFNHPFNLIIHQVVPAIAVGCPVIVKPASATPLSCRNLVNILYEAGLSKEWCQMVLCENETAEKMISDKRIAFLTFIGSSKVGWHLRAKLAPGAGCAMEHGGAAPVIFDETADMDEAMPLLVKGGFYHAGQVCVSVQRVYVHKSMVEEFSKKMTRLVQNLKVGNPLHEDTEVGPLISPSEVDRVHEWVMEAAQKGATILCGGEKLSNNCYKPTVLLNPPEDVNVSQKEIFGPVVSIYSFQERDEAIARANQLNFCFQAAVFTRNIDVALDTVKKLNAMAVMVNDHTAFRVDWMPFGGSRESGLGIGGIGPAMQEMAIEKLMVIKSEAV
ncbi:MAG: aldehyde dehydrogenase family protein [Deltaproteobacteria bacterium]|nr:aldehyde dehydrogenase family protein [Deltaproteobacteria bacterium]